MTRLSTRQAGAGGHRARCIFALSCGVMCLAVSACGGGFDDVSSDWYGVDRPDAYEAGGGLSGAEASLIRHDVLGANRQYEEEVERDDALTVGTSSAGLALTNLFLLPDSDATRRLVSQGLDATYSGYSTQRLVWGREGAVDLFHQGSPWEDDGVFVGAKSLLADELPWSVSRLESVASFVGPLNEAVNGMTPILVDVAGDLQAIEQQLQVAIQDPKFEYYYLPASVFHDDALAFTLGKSELAALHGMLSSLRGGIYLFAAYEHRWSLTGIFGDASASATGVDYERLDDVWLREIATKSHLRESKRAFQDGLDLFAQSITFGLAQQEESFSELSVLRWDRVSRDQVRKVRDLLQSLSYALDEPTKMPHFSMDFTLDLSSFFDSGRTLDEEIEWFTYADGRGGEVEIGEDAFFAFFEREVFSPEATKGEAYPAEFDLDEEDLDGLFEGLLGVTNARIEESFGL